MTYVSEITMPQMRGPHLSAFALFFAIGQLASAIGLDVIEKTDPLNFRLAFYSQFAILGVWAPICILLPESPVWLCKKGKHDRAKRSLRRLIGNVEGYDVEHEYKLIQQDVAASLILMERSSKHDWIACFRGTNLRRTLLSTIPFSMQVSLTWAKTATCDDVEKSYEPEETLPCSVPSCRLKPSGAMLTPLEFCGRTPHAERGLLFEFGTYHVLAVEKRDKLTFRSVWTARSSPTSLFSPSSCLVSSYPSLWLIEWVAGHF